MRLTSRLTTTLAVLAAAFALAVGPAAASGISVAVAPLPPAAASEPVPEAASPHAETPKAAIAPAAVAPAYEAGCPEKPAPGFYTCYSLHRINNRPHVAAATHAGYTPANLTAAYGLPSGTAGAGQTVYVIDAFGYPNAESDLQTYRNYYHLPACTSANGCFKKINQRGGSSGFPPYDDGWAAETALDLDMVSAVCPKCKITLIEADDNGDNLFLAVAKANSMGAKYVSMSWGGQETGDEAYYDSTFFNRTGVVYSASSGDNGYLGGNSYPATSKNALSIGGTSLVPDNSVPRRWTESTWAGTGSSCSGDEPKQKWQLIIAPSVCRNRAGNDISAVSDPNTGVAVYQRGSPYGDWSVSGGTSAAAPIIAAVYALAGPPAAGDHPVSYLYARTGALNDVTGGNNGVCTSSQLCTGAAGWDGPTGLGTPRGISAFIKPSRVVVLTNAGNRAASVGNSVSVQFSATVAPLTTLTYTAAGLPAGLAISSTGKVTGSPSTPGVSTVRVTATASAGPAAASSIYFSWTVGTAGTFTSVDATRILDTRNGLGANPVIVPAGAAVNLQVLGAGVVPASGVSGVVLNVTVTQPGNAGYVTVYPGGTAKPTTSNLNYLKGQTVPNLVFAPVGADGKVRLYTSATAHLIADVSGYYLGGTPTNAGAFGSLTPKRILDTRHGIGAPMAEVPDTGTVPLAVLGRGGVPAVNVSAVVLNLTATGAAANGFVTAYPHGQDEPRASTLNFAAGRTVPNLVVVAVGTGGIVDLAVHLGGGTSLVADVMGYFVGPVADGTVAGTFHPLTPTRVLDSRNGTGGASSPLNGGDSVQVFLTPPNGPLPTTGVSAVVLNVLVVKPTGTGYITAYSDASQQPTASNLNFVRGQTVANLVVVPVGPDGGIDLTFDGSGSVDLVADVAGYFYG
ncbi:hypothetical protein ABIB25_003364 [Nakamurella sp. UYEF19]|uniref:S53 family peptidase n=1 Tax=Nakamurella sp. UYEF19 TaxID=1756392 RepID=UPI0033958EA7